MTEDLKWADVLRGMEKTMDRCPLLQVFLHGFYQPLYQLIRRADPIYMNTLHHIQGKCINMLLLTFLHKPHVPEVDHTGILMCGYSWRFIFKTIQTEYLQHISSLFCINTFRGFFFWGGGGVKGYGRMWGALQLLIHRVRKWFIIFSSTLQMESCWRHIISAPDPASLGVWGPESCRLPGPLRQTGWAQPWWYPQRT